MPLTAQEKNAIAQGGVSLAGAGLVSSGAVVAGGPLVLLAPLAIGLAAQFLRPRFPTVDVGVLAGSTQGLLRRGLEPVISRDPFGTSLVLSAADQAPFLLELLRNRAIRREAATVDTSSIFREREALIEGLAESAVERGFLSEIPEELRGGVFRPTAESPLQFVEGEFL